MHKTTPNWEEIANILVFKLDEIADGINWKVECGEDPALTVDDSLEEIKLLISAIESNPSQFNMKDVS